MVASCILYISLARVLSRLVLLKFLLPNLRGIFQRPVSRGAIANRPAMSFAGMYSAKPNPISRANLEADARNRTLFANIPKDPRRETQSRTINSFSG